MKISKEINWLLPFIHSVEKLYPKIKKVEAIQTMRFSYKARDRAIALLEDQDNGKFKVKLRTHYQHIDFYPLTVTKMALSKIDLLTSLAHELAHLYFWTHTPEHKILENQLLMVFMYKLKQQGYISEEEELK